MRTAIRAAPCNCDVISNYDLFTSKTASACFQGFPCITARVLLFFKKDRVHELSTSNTGLALCAYPCHRKNPLRQNFLYWVKQYWNGTIKISSITMHGVWQWTVCSAVSRFTHFRLWPQKADIIDVGNHLFLQLIKDLFEGLQF